MHWFKFYGKDFLTDPKIRHLNPIHQLMWVYLLCHASDTESGHVRFIDENDLVTAIGIMPQDDEFEVAKGFFEQCKKMDMLEILEDGVLVKNFKKRQESYLSGAERTANWRLRKKQEQRHTGDMKPRYASGARTDKIRIDKIRIDKINTFARFWEVYPRKTGKKAAERVWLKLKPSEELIQRILAAVEVHKKSPQWTKDGNQFVPYPATFLNQERWNDEGIEEVKVYRINTKE